MKTIGVLFTVVLMIVCFCLWVSRDKAVNETSKLRCTNAKLDNTVKTQAKTIKELNACIVSQKATIATRTDENNKKYDKIKQLAVRIVNLQSLNHKLKAKRNYKTTKKYKKKKIKKVYKKPAKSSRQIRYEKEIKGLIEKNTKVWKLYIKYKKEYSTCSSSIGGSRKSKERKKKKLNSIKLLKTKYYNEWKKRKEKIEKLKLRLK